MTEFSDTELLSAMKRGEHEAFRLLYERHWERLYEQALCKLGSGADAADMIQDLFIKIWEKRAELEINTSLEAYLFIALKNRVINFYKRKFTYQQSLQSAASANNSGNYIQQDLAYRETAGIIADETQQMPVRMRAVFQLRLEGHTAQDIGERLSISEQTVRNQISHALKKLRGRLGKET